MPTKRAVSKKAAGSRSGAGLSLARLRRVSGEARWSLIHDWMWKRLRTYKRIAAMQRHVLTLPKGMRALWTTYELDCDVRNGGFEQYFANSFSNLVEEAIRGFTLIGRRDIASVVRSAKQAARSVHARSAPTSAKRATPQASTRAAARLRRLDETYFRLVKKRPTPETRMDLWIDQHLDDFVF